MGRRRLRFTLLLAEVITVLAIASNPLAAELSGPQPQDRYLARVVVALMSQNHYLRLPISDEISRRTFDAYLGQLDPAKLYFDQSDVDEFSSSRDKIDDMMTHGDMSLAYTMYKRFSDRVDARVKLAGDLLEQEYDFTTDETMNVDRKSFRFAANEAESRERWRQRVKHELLLLKADNVTMEEARQRLTRRYENYASKIRDTSPDELREVFLSAFTGSFDPHSAYMAPATLNDYRIQQRIQLEGIGAALQTTDGEIIVSRIITGSAADRHGGLQAEDRIVGIGQGEDGELVNVRGKSLRDVVQLIRGPRGTVVRLEVLPVEKTETQLHVITRGNIELTDSRASSRVVKHGEEKDGSPGRVGWIKLPRLYVDTEGARAGLPNYASATRDVRQQLQTLKDKDVDVVVLDLRFADGDDLSEAIQLPGLFIDQGVIVQMRDGTGRVQRLDDRDAGVVWEGPLVVLTNRFTSGTAEVVVAAIQDYDRGLVIGDETTRGKGTTQTLMDLSEKLFGQVAGLPDLGALRLTTQQVFRINGASIQQRGVAADVVLPSISNEMDVSEAQLDHALAFDQIPAADFTPLGMTKEEVVVGIRERSEKRRIESREFQKVAESIADYRERKNHSTVTLNEQTLIAERQGNARGEEAISAEPFVPGIDGSNDYLNEVIQIALDYVDEISRQ